MADFFGKLVVRAYASPKRRAWFLGSAGVLAALILYGMFELGRFDAGYRVVDTVRGAWASSARVRELEAENARLRNELTAADVGRRIDRESYKQVQSSVGDMQSQIARLTQDLSFYRGLVQPGKPDNTVWGTLAVTIQGLTAGKPQTLKFSDVSVDRRAGLAYSFRYFEDYDEAVQLPPTFEPTRIDVELFTGKDSAHGFRQAFVWKAQGMSVETEANGEASKEKSDVQTESE